MKLRTRACSPPELETTGAVPTRNPDAANRIVQKLRSYCNVLRDDGLSYQEYLEQLTFLLFLKMADERARLTDDVQPIPVGYRWADLAAPHMEGVELEQHYRETLRELGRQGGIRPDLREGAEQDPGPCQVAAGCGRADRQGGLVVDVRRREGRRVRGAARTCSTCIPRIRSQGQTLSRT